MEEMEHQAVISSIEQKNKRLKSIKGGLFLASLTGFSLLSGFGFAISMAKKQDPNGFSKGIAAYQGMSESGGSLALRALGRATVYSVGSVGLITFILWKLMCVNSMQEFTAKVQSMIPKIPKNEPSGKSNFKTIRELIDYLISEDRKSEKKSN